jgi:hypothetical protein
MSAHPLRRMCARVFSTEPCADLPPTRRVAREPDRNPDTHDSCRFCRRGIQTDPRELNTSGLSEAEVRRIARDFGRSIPVLRRHRFRSSARTPSWSDHRTAPTLIPILFCGAWDEKTEGDTNMVESLCGTTHQEYLQALKPLLKIEDAPICRGPITSPQRSGVSAREPGVRDR